VDWLRAVESLRSQRRVGVLVTVAAVRGHAPREAGAKMVVAEDGTWGTIGGGNLEETAVSRARDLMDDPTGGVEVLEVSLTEHAPVEHGTQCCGGEVSLLLEPLRVVPAVVVFGMGHVGLELARILARHDIELHLVDSRSDRVSDDALTVLADPVARIHVHHAPVPELVLGCVPHGSHVLVMTHDHAEDVALCDAALRCAHLGSVGLIGSTAKWRRFERRLREEGHSDADIAGIHTPIGLPEVAGKEPASVALSVAADLLRTFARERAGTGAAR
jgi:xanthine dehydrogenase accessory factor